MAKKVELSWVFEVRGTSVLTLMTSPIFKSYCRTLQLILHGSLLYKTDASGADSGPEADLLILLLVMALKRYPLTTLYP